MSGAGGLGGLQLMRIANCALPLRCYWQAVVLAAAAMLSWTPCACVSGGRVRRQVQTGMSAAMQAGGGALP